MIVTSTSKGFSLIFANREDLQSVVTHLTDYLDNLPEGDGAIYTYASAYIPIEETKELNTWLKGKFTKND